VTQIDQFFTSGGEQVKAYPKRASVLSQTIHCWSTIDTVSAPHREGSAPLSQLVLTQMWRWWCSEKYL
jgi:hypothetical protein